MDVSAIVLHKLLAGKDLDTWAKLKLVFLDPAFSSLYTAISKFYDLHNTIPSFEELEITLREGPALKTLATLKLADEQDITVDVAMAALLDQYTQNQTISLLDKFIDKLAVYDSAEIKENLATIVLTLDEKTMTTEGVYSMADIMLFKNAEELARDRVFLGFNNTFDANLAGVARQELILIGGKRGAGNQCSWNVNFHVFKATKSRPYGCADHRIRRSRRFARCRAAAFRFESVRARLLTVIVCMAHTSCRVFWG